MYDYLFDFSNIFSRDSTVIRMIGKLFNKETAKHIKPIHYTFIVSFKYMRTENIIIIIIIITIIIIIIMITTIIIIIMSTGCMTLPLNQSNTQ